MVFSVVVASQSLINPFPRQLIGDLHWRQAEEELLRQLQQLFLAHGKTPVYRPKSRMPEKDGTYTMEVLIDEKVIGRGTHKQRAVAGEIALGMALNHGKQESAGHAATVAPAPGTLQPGLAAGGNTIGAVNMSSAEKELMDQLQRLCIAAANGAKIKLPELRAKQKKMAGRESMWHVDVVYAGHVLGTGANGRRSVAGEAALEAAIRVRGAVAKQASIVAAPGRPRMCSEPGCNETNNLEADQDNPHEVYCQKCWVTYLAGSSPKEPGLPAPLHANVATVQSAAAPPPDVGAWDRPAASASQPQLSEEYGAVYHTEPAQAVTAAPDQPEQSSSSEPAASVDPELAKFPTVPQAQLGITSMLPGLSVGASTFVPGGTKKSTEGWTPPSSTPAVGSDSETVKSPSDWSTGQDQPSWNSDSATADKATGPSAEWKASSGTSSGSEWVAKPDVSEWSRSSRATSTALPPAADETSTRSGAPGTELPWQMPGVQAAQSRTLGMGDANTRSWQPASTVRPAVAPVPVPNPSAGWSSADQGWSQSSPDGGSAPGAAGWGQPRPEPVPTVSSAGPAKPVPTGVAKAAGWSTGEAKGSWNGQSASVVSGSSGPRVQNKMPEVNPGWGMPPPQPPMGGWRSDDRMVSCCVPYCFVYQAAAFINYVRRF